MFFPGRFVDLLQLGFARLIDQLLVRRRGRQARLVERLINDSEAELQLQSILNQLLNACARQPHPKRRTHQQRRQQRPHQAPLTERGLRLQAPSGRSCTPLAGRLPVRCPHPQVISP